MRAMAPDGQCKTFDESGDGYGRAEACGAVLLGRMDRVEGSDVGGSGGSTVAPPPSWGYVRGTATNQDGKSASFMAPNGPAQQAVIRSAMRDGVVEKELVQHVECHGTGTSLGDPIEVAAIGRVLGVAQSTETERKTPALTLGALKSCVGHAEGAAGIMGGV